MLVLMAPMAQAQPDCMTEVDEMDPFTKRRVVSVAPTAVSTGPFYRWRAENDRWCLQFTWQIPGTAPAVVLQGDTLMLLLENDSVMILTSASTTVGTVSTDAHGRPHTSGTYDYGITRAQTKLLDRYWVKRMRIQFQQGPQEFEADKDPLWQHSVTRTASCFLLTCSSPPVPSNSTIGEKH